MTDELYLIQTPIHHRDNTPIQVPDTSKQDKKPQKIQDKTPKKDAYIADGRRTLFASALTGLAVGFIGWLASLAVSAWLIEPIFCRTTETFAVCSNGGTVGWGIAMVLVSIGGLFGLIRAGIYRPLLVVLASLITLWQVSTWLGPLEWWQGLLWHTVLFAVAYAAFAWIARISLFLIALIITVLAIIAARFLILNS